MRASSPSLDILVTRLSDVSKCRPIIFGASPVVLSILIQTSSPRLAMSTPEPDFSIDEIAPINKFSLRWNFKNFKVFHDKISEKSGKNFGGKILIDTKKFRSNLSPWKCFWLFWFSRTIFKNQKSVNHENFFVRFPTKMSQNLPEGQIRTTLQFSPNPWNFSFWKKGESLIFSSHYLFSYTNRCTLPQLTILDFNTDNNGVSLGKDTIR